MHGEGILCCVDSLIPVASVGGVTASGCEAAAVREASTVGCGAVGEVIASGRGAGKAVDDVTVSGICNPVVKMVGITCLDVAVSPYLVLLL